MLREGMCLARDHHKVTRAGLEYRSLSLQIHFLGPVCSNNVLLNHSYLQITDTLPAPTLASKALHYFSLDPKTNKHLRLQAQGSRGCHAESNSCHQLHRPQTVSSSPQLGRPLDLGPGAPSPPLAIPVGERRALAFSRLTLPTAPPARLKVP